RGEGQRERELRHRDSNRFTGSGPVSPLSTVKSSGERLPGARLLTLLSVGFLAAGCGSKQSSLSPASPSSHGIATLWWIMLAGSAFGLALIAAILIGSWFKRAHAGSDRPAMLVVLSL